MVDLAVNHIASTNTDISDSALASKSDGKLLFKKESEYHPVCKINYDDKKSVEQWYVPSRLKALRKPELIRQLDGPGRRGAHGPQNGECRGG